MRSTARRRRSSRAYRAEAITPSRTNSLEWRFTMATTPGKFGNSCYTPRSAIAKIFSGVRVLPITALQCVFPEVVAVFRPKEPLGHAVETDSVAPAAFLRPLYAASCAGVRQLVARRSRRISQQRGDRRLAIV